MTWKLKREEERKKEKERERERKRAGAGAKSAFETKTRRLAKIKNLEERKETEKGRKKGRKSIARNRIECHSEGRMQMTREFEGTRRPTFVCIFEARDHQVCAY